MKIKLLVPICGPEGNFKTGDEPDLSDVLAKALIKDGHAESLDVVKPAEAKTEVNPKDEAKTEVKPDDEVKTAISSDKKSKKK